MSSRLMTLGAIVAAMSAVACIAPRVRETGGTAAHDRVLAAYRASAACVDSVAVLHGFEPTEMQPVGERTQEWTLAIRRPSPPVEGAEFERVWATFDLTQGRDLARLRRTGSRAGRYVTYDERAERTLAPRPHLQLASNRLPVPPATTRAAIQRIEESCAIIAFRAP